MHDRLYKNTLGWSAGPHLFTDEDQIWGMCDFSKKGVHAVSFNKRAIGIEVLERLTPMHLHRVYVVDEDRKPVSIVTLTDVLRIVAKA